MLVLPPPRISLEKRAIVLGKIPPPKDKITNSGGG
jgi:hypothetical protein